MADAEVLDRLVLSKVLVIARNAGLLESKVVLFPEAFDSILGPTEPPSRGHFLHVQDASGFGIGNLSNQLADQIDELWTGLASAGRDRSLLYEKLGVYTALPVDRDLDVLLVLVKDVKDFVDRCPRNDTLERLAILPSHASIRAMGGRFTFS